MEVIHSSTIDTLIRAMQDRLNPTAAHEAFTKGDRWVQDEDLGLVTIAPDVLQRLKDALNA